MAVKGLERVRKNLRIVAKDITLQKTEGAVYAVLSQGAAAAAVKTPVDTSTLINSQYAPQIVTTEGKTSGHSGYTAEYAGAVHDAPGALKGVPRPQKVHEPGRGNYWDPTGEPKFLEKGFEETKKHIPAILKSIYGV